MDLLAKIVTSPVFSALLGAVVGALIGIVGTYKYSRRLLTAQKLIEIAADFRSAFVETKRLLDKRHFYDLYSNYYDPVYNILEKHISDQERAMIKFSSFVRDETLGGFNSAWAAYYSQSQDGADYHLNDYSCERCHKTDKTIPNSLEQKRQLALDRIDRLLKFADVR